MRKILYLLIVSIVIGLLIGHWVKVESVFPNVIEQTMEFRG